AGRGDEATALGYTLAAQKQRGNALGLADRSDVVFVSRMLETIDGLADQESVRAEEGFVDEVDAAWKRNGGRLRHRRCWLQGHILGRRLRACGDRFGRRLDERRLGGGRFLGGCGFGRGNRRWWCRGPSWARTRFRLRHRHRFGRRRHLGDRRL